MIKQMKKEINFSKFRNFETIKIGILGCGTIGSAIIERILREKIVRRKELFVSDVNKKKEREAVLKYKIQALENDKLLEQSDFVILAVKPRDFLPFAKEVSFPKNKIVISIIGGVKINSIKKILEVKKVVRAMPNLMIKIGRGLIVWKAIELSSDEISKVRKIFNALGEEIRVKDENLIEQATLISGCGPGYLYFFEDLLLKSFTYLGFSRDFTLKLLLETFLGAILYQKENGYKLDTLVKMVATKGGITEKFIETLKKNKIQEIFAQAAQDAYRKNMERKL